MEACGTKPVRGQAATVDSVVKALRLKGVEIDADAGIVRLVKTASRLRR
jgi:hypothetical protein